MKDGWIVFLALALVAGAFVLQGCEDDDSPSTTINGDVNIVDANNNSEVNINNDNGNSNDNK